MLRTVTPARAYADADAACPTIEAILPHLFLLGLGLLLCLLYAVDARRLPLTSVANVASLCAVAAVLMAVRVSPRRLWSASAVYLIVLTIFHLGLTAIYGLDLPLGDGAFMDWLQEWFYTPFTNEAVLLAAIGIVSCAAGVIVALLLGARTTGRVPPDRLSVYAPFATAGLALVLVSVSLWLIIAVRAGGVGILIGGYENFLSVVGESTPQTLAFYGINLGTTCLAAARPSRLRRAGFTVFALWALIALPLGFRGFVLFPGLTIFVIIAKRRRPFSARMALLIGLVALSGIAALRQVRQVGVQNVSAATVTTGSPLAGLTELGSSLRPLSETVYWHETGDPFIMGASYWAPLDRTITRLFPARDWKLPPAEEDPRVLTSLAQMRGAGSIAFSVVAEAYRNFGSPGVCLIMFSIGILLGRMDLWPATPVRDVMLGAVLVPLLFEVRNDFTAVPLQILLGVLLLGATLLIARTIREVTGARTSLT